jgi:hypothetical protein
MLSIATKQRIARNRKLRANPKWVQKVEMYIHHLKTTSISSSAVLSTKHLLDPAQQAAAEADLNARWAKLNAQVASLALISRAEWYELEQTLPIEHRWTPHQMKRTIKACGGYRAVIEAHGGYRNKIAPKSVFANQASVPMGNWDNPATLDDWMNKGDEWEAEHGDPQ